MLITSYSFEKQAGSGDPATETQLAADWQVPPPLPLLLVVPLLDPLPLLLVEAPEENPELEPETPELEPVTPELDPANPPGLRHARQRLTPQALVASTSDA